MIKKTNKKKQVIRGRHAKTYALTRKRLIIFTSFLILGYLTISLRLIHLTLLNQKEKTDITHIESIHPLKKPLRASIFDRQGTLIATSLKMASLYADTTIIEDPETLSKKLLDILPDQTLETLIEKLSSGKKFIWVQRNITPKQTYAINALGNPALRFQEEDRRVYPNAHLTSHITGYTDIDGKGIAGIENTFNTELSEENTPINLSIDLRVQYILRNELKKSIKKFKAKNGIGTIMDVNTGEIIAMVSLPDFDPNHLRFAKDKETFNRATLGVFEMGSTFKLFSTAAALDSGEVALSTKFDATYPIKMGRFKISDSHPKKRPLTIPEIFIYSSNIGTAKMARFIGNEKMKEFYYNLGFMDRVPVELSERGMPLYPFPWRDISTLTTSFGHGIAVSPLHVVRAASALVNGGIMPPATLIKKDAHSVSLREENRVISKKTSDQLRQLLELVVVNGTGRNAYVQGYNVGGKTGTAEKNIQGGYKNDILLSSFLGVFPIEKPRYVILVILDEPQPTKDTHNSATGGWTAAPVVARVIEQIGPLYQIPPNKKRMRKKIAKEMRKYLKHSKGGGLIVSLRTDR